MVTASNLEVLEVGLNGAMSNLRLSFLTFLSPPFIASLVYVNNLIHVDLDLE